ncbi:MAG: hypothetical protein LIO97_01545, partial [Tannerellaceae bacterium]|nr:hypothetical protein [Tannerellaceae bacterium]
MSIINAATAQKKKVYLFDSFTNGKVLMKNKNTITAELNYDAANKKMIYKDNGEDMILVNTQVIDTVFVGTQKFIPAGRIFLEVVPASNGNIYIN